MKAIFIFLTLFLSLPVFAEFDFCDQEADFSVVNAVEDKQFIRLIEKKAESLYENKSAKDTEKNMILAVVDSAYQHVTEFTKALEMFADAPHYSNGGSILYFKTSKNSDVYAYVFYFPGENEYGAVFQKLDGVYTKIATVNDGDMTCSAE